MEVPDDIISISVVPDDAMRISIFSVEVPDGTSFARLASSSFWSSSAHFGNRDAYQTKPNRTKPNKSKPNQINHRNQSRTANNHAKLSQLRIVMCDKTYLAAIWFSLQYNNT